MKRSIGKFFCTINNVFAFFPQNLLSLALLILLVFTSFLASAQTTYHSKQSGNWSNKNTWLENNIPSSSDHAIINPGHTVTFVSSNSVKNLTIESGGVITDNGLTNTVSGNFVVNGTYSGTGPLNLTGVNTNIGGVGVISNTSTIITVTGNKTILTGTDLTINNSNLIINGAFTITNLGTLTTGGLISGTVAGSTWTNEVNSVLNIGGNPGVITASPLLNGVGTLNASALGNTINYFSPASITIKLPSLASGYHNYYHLEITGTNVKYLPDGDIAINGDLTISSSLNGSGNLKRLFLRGNWINNGSFTEGSGLGTVTFDGITDQSIFRSATENLNNLVVNKPSGTLILKASVIVETGLTLISGNINTGIYKITLGQNITNTGVFSWTSGTIIGKFERWIKSTDIAIPIDFPIGTASFHRPVSLYFTSLTPGSLIAEFKSTAPANNGMPLSENTITLNNTFRDGFWSLTTTNTLDTLTYNLDLTGNGFVGFPINDNTRLLTRTSSSTPWTLNGTHVVRTGNIIKRSGVNKLGEFCFGSDALCTAPVTSAVTGSTNECLNSSGKVYSVTNTPGSTYTWTVNGGTQVSGGTTNSITVNWGSTGLVGSVAVLENNGCTLGSDIILNVNVHPIAPSVITGKANVPQSIAADETYSVPSQTGYTFTWTVVGGTIVSGQGTRSIKVSWGVAGSGSVSVRGVHSCGTSVPTLLPVTIYKVILSKKSGNWNTAANWDCSCVPGSSDNITILNTHSITVDNNSGSGRSAKNVNINQGGILNTSTNALTISGDLSVNGTLSGTSNVTLSGSGTSVGGTGTITNSGLLNIVGNKVIEATANLTKLSGAVNIAASTIVSNNGSITIVGNIIGGDGDSVWDNKSNSSLIVGGDLLTIGELNAFDIQNTIRYNGALSQSVKVPTSSQYYHLILSGTGNKNMPASRIALMGDLTNDSPFTHNNGIVAFNGISSLLGSVNPLFYSISIETGGTFSGPVSLDLERHFENNGTFNSGSSNTVYFRGTNSQEIKGNTITNFRNIRVNKSAGSVQVQTNQNILGTLSVEAGTFDADGTSNLAVLTLKSTNDRPTQDASIGKVSGLIIGNVTAERFISAQGITNRYFSSPLADVTIEELQDDFSVTGPFVGSSFPCSGCTNRSSLRYYDETVPGTLEKGYLPYPAPGGHKTDLLTVGRGYLGWMYRNENVTWDMTGTVNQGTIQLPVSYTSSAGNVNDGWNLVGNPYASSIAWNNATNAAGWTMTNIDPVVSVTDLTIQTGYPNYFRSFNFFDQTGDLTGGVIAMGQSFWVKANAVNPVLTINEDAKVGTGSGNFYRKSSPSEQLVISINNGKYEDKSYFKLNNSATDDFDKLLDGHKLKNEFLNVYLLDESNRDLVMHTLSAVTQETKIVIGIDVNEAGMYHLSFSNFENFSLGSSLYLIDTFEEIAMPISALKLSEGYTFKVMSPVSRLTDRFYLSLSNKVEKKSVENVFIYPNPVKDFLNIRSQGTYDGITVTIFDSSGKTMVTMDALEESILDMRNYPEGMYILKAKSKQGVVVKKIFKND